MNEIKSAIARIFTAVINADGIVSTKELEHLEKVIMPKYGLKASDFKEVDYTFAEAVNTIKTPEGERYLKKRYKKKEEKKKNRRGEKDKKVLSFTEDMEELARADGGIHPKEALLCLSFRLAMEDDGTLSLVSFNNNELRFSKQEIIYVENEWDEEINEEISNNYDAIRYMLQSFGYHFIYLPKVREEFSGYSEDYKVQLIKYYYPSRYAETERDNLLGQFNNKLQGNIDKYKVTKSFCEMLFEGNEHKIKPAFLIKIGTTQKRNPNGLTDFIMLRIREKEVHNTLACTGCQYYNDMFKIPDNRALDTLQHFLNKYDRLCEKNDVLVHRGGIVSSGFNLKSFYGTFLEYLYRRVEKMAFHIHGAVIDMHLGDSYTKSFKINKSNCSELALYLTELYYSNTGGFVYESEKKRESLKTAMLDDDMFEQLTEQYEKFKLIYNGLTNGGLIPYCKYNEELLYGEFTTMQSNFREKIKGSPMVMKYFPPYDKQNKIILIPEVICEVNGVLLREWVKSLK